MTTKIMKEKDQIEALVKLAGWRLERDDDGEFRLIDADGECVSSEFDPDTTLMSFEHWFPDYLNSRDAIIPLIERNYPDLVARHLCEVITKSGQYHGSVTFAQIMTATPAKLCEALLRATNLWTE